VRVVAYRALDAADDDTPDWKHPSTPVRIRTDRLPDEGMLSGDFSMAGDGAWSFTYAYRTHGTTWVLCVLAVTPKQAEGSSGEPPKPEKAYKWLSLTVLPGALQPRGRPQPAVLEAARCLHQPI
jgi:hypothetical protein